MLKDRKGMALRDIVPAAFLIVVGGVALSVGASVTAEVEADATSGSAAAYAANNATDGLLELSTWLPTIGLVIAAGIIIGILVKAFR